MSGFWDEDDLAEEGGCISKALAAQKDYYELRAPDYSSWTKPPDRVAHGLFPADLAEGVFDELRPRGDVLELACGPGPLFTSVLIHHAATVTAVDASRTALRLNQVRVGDQKVTYVEADLFEWSPSRCYDFVFFGHWLSHIPPTRFDAFWDLLRKCVAPNGRVGFIDEDTRAASLERRPSQHAWMARRTLGDGREFDIVKVFWRPDELEHRLTSLGWEIRVQPIAERFMVGVGQPQLRPNRT